MRLAEDYDIFISKAQLDSILVNYTRSGSLLFRKLVYISTLISSQVIRFMLYVLYFCIGMKTKIGSHMKSLCVQVCAFFDDATLANSLPNGKRKRGLNDNRKGLDQNIVGAIKGIGKKDAADSICHFHSG